jgi:hypothetical protein
MQSREVGTGFPRPGLRTVGVSDEVRRGEKKLWQQILSEAGTLWIYLAACLLLVPG